MLIINGTGGSSWLTGNANVDVWTNDTPLESLTGALRRISVNSFTVADKADFIVPDIRYNELLSRKLTISRKYTQLDLSGLLNLNVMQVFENTFDNINRGLPVNSTTFFAQIGSSNTDTTNKYKMTGMVFDTFNINIPNTGYLTFDFSLIGNTPIQLEQNLLRYGSQDRYFTLQNCQINSNLLGIFNILSLSLNIIIENNRIHTVLSLYDLRPHRGQTDAFLTISCILSPVILNQFKLAFLSNQLNTYTMILNNGTDYITTVVLGTIISLETPVENDGYILCNMIIKLGNENSTSDLLTFAMG